MAFSVKIKNKLCWVLCTVLHVISHTYKRQTIKKKFPKKLQSRCVYRTLHITKVWVAQWIEHLTFKQVAAGLNRILAESLLTRWHYYITGECGDGWLEWPESARADRGSCAGRALNTLSLHWTARHRRLQQRRLQRCYLHLQVWVGVIQWHTFHF